MSVDFFRTNAAIVDCQRHLEDTKTFGTVIESFLTQHILVIMCAEIQIEVYQMLEKRADILADKDMKNYVVASGKRIFRSVQKDSIAGLAELFGPHVKEKLNTVLDDREVTLYNNAVFNRHDVAHSTGVNISFQEVKAAVDAAKNILTSFETCIQPSS